MFHYLNIIQPSSSLAAQRNLQQHLVASTQPDQSHSGVLPAADGIENGETSQNSEDFMDAAVINLHEEEVSLSSMSLACLQEVEDGAQQLLAAPLLLPQLPAQLPESISNSVQQLSIIKLVQQTESGPSGDLKLSQQLFRRGSSYRSSTFFMLSVSLLKGFKMPSIILSSSVAMGFHQISPAAQ
ncbi:hypothetical protein M9H77_18606 [Catharanthus roseus]|uniref:Uncharacterized protein n=1 Tax=Catharanthus roseus TaxID=4058 RepID=A0ACC0B874_CATRO|nr:hypothetical protein M9H77_18606 [Catharanthus roseus]